MHYQSNRQLQERATALPVDEVLVRAARFFARRSGLYSAFVEKQGPGYIVLRGQGGEEIAIAARVTDNGTMVTGGTYLFDAQIARFFGSLPPALPVVASLASAHADTATPAIASTPAVP